MLEDTKLYEQIHQIYIKSTKGGLFMSRDYVSGDYCHVYIRFTQRYSLCKKSIINTVDIGQIDVKLTYQGKGVFKSLINHLKYNYPKHAVFIELVHSPELHRYLSRDPRFMLYTSDDNVVPSYISYAE